MRNLLIPALLASCFLPLPSTAKPNIIVIVADDLGYGDLGFTGHPKIKTPHLDKLSKNGATFTNFYSPAQVCSAARAAMMTGRMPHRHGLYSFIGGSSGNLTHLPKSEITLPQLLRKNGYQTAIFGKWHCSLIQVQMQRAAAGKNDIPSMHDYGFDYYFCSDDNAKIRNKPNWIRNGKNEGTRKGLAANVIGSEAVRWVTKERDPNKPFIQFVHFYEPHWYVDAPQEITDQYLGKHTNNKNEAIYFAAVTNVDQEIGKIHRALEKLGIAKNTLILFTSDHGPARLGKANKNRNYGTANPYRGNKYGLWDGSIHTPGIAHWPARIKANTAIKTPAGAIDWFPTICEITNTPLPNNLELDGQSHLPLLLNQPFSRTKPLQWHHYNTNFINSPNPNAVMRVGDYIICGFYHPKTQLKRSSWKEHHLKLIKNGKLVRFQLFNITQDPAQKADLSKQELKRFQKLKSALIAAHQKMQREAIGWQGTEPIKKLP
ncbi:MAG: sulfatase family protein [Akkermansiaceae bacterium]